MGSRNVTSDASTAMRHAVFQGVVAIDGPSGTGKSTVARELAVRLGVRYLDTGAMYRAATLAVLERQVALDDISGIVSVVRQADIEISTDPSGIEVTLNGRRVDAEIRSAEVTAAVSAVSAIEPVRRQLVAAQRELIGTGAIVVEGRDIGTVVWPGAKPKVYLTANPGVRARRRADQLGHDARGLDSIGQDGVIEVAAALARRDDFDSNRAVSPLVPAADAFELDTTELSIDEVVQRLVDMTMALASRG